MGRLVGRAAVLVLLALTTTASAGAASSVDPHVVAAGDPAGCVRHSPTPIIDGSILRVKRGTTARFPNHVALVNNDSAECGPTTFTLTLIAQTASRYLTATLNGKTTYTIAVQPGETRWLPLRATASAKLPRTGATRYYGFDIRNTTTADVYKWRGVFAVRGAY